MTATIQSSRPTLWLQSSTSCPGKVVLTFCAGTGAANVSAFHNREEIVNSSVMVNFCNALSVCLCLLAVSARPPEAKEQKKGRVYDADLSAEEHFKEEEHNAEYDHEAFLGEEKKKFDELTPEESKERLG